VEDLLTKRRRPVPTSVLRICGLILLIPPVLSGQSRLEIRPVNSVTLTAQQFLTGDDKHEPVTLAGEFRVPVSDSRYSAGSPAPTADGSWPAVILIHGSAGILPYHERWVQELNSSGIATFLVDSFSARGIVNTADDQAQLATLAMMVDAYRALDVVARDPRIDRNRIAVMGFSKGAVASVYSSSVRFTKIYAPQQVRFAAHIGIYTPCFRYREDAVVTGAPIRLFHGASDDFVASEACRLYVAELVRNGADAALTVYPDAHHLYDNFLQGPLTTDPAAQSFRRCQLVEGDRGVLVNAKTNQPFALDDACVQRGASRGYNGAAAEATVAAVKAFLASTLGPKR
jgi:dienelactone hydrolase